MDLQKSKYITSASDHCVSQLSIEVRCTFQPGQLVAFPRNMKRGSSCACACVLSEKLISCCRGLDMQTYTRFEVTLRECLHLIELEEQIVHGRSFKKIVGNFLGPQSLF